MTYNPRLVNQDNAQLLLNANNVTASTAQFTTLTCSGDFLVNNFTAYGRTNLSVTPNVAYIDYSEEADKLLMFPGLYVTGTITASVGLSIGSTNGFQVNSAGNIIKLNGQATSFPSNLGTNGSLLHTDGAGSLTWVNQSTLNVYSANRTSNIIGGTAGKIPYQAGITNTEFIEVGTAGQVLTSNGSSAPTWVNQNTLDVNSSATARNVNVYTEYTGGLANTYLNITYVTGPAPPPDFSAKLYTDNSLLWNPSQNVLSASNISASNITLSNNIIVTGSIVAASFNSTDTTFNVPAKFNSTVEIQQSSSLNSLTVKQLGSGYAVVVIDESGDDQSFFAIDSSGNVGIGISNFTPNTKLQVDGKTLLQANSAEPVLKITQFGTGNCLVVEDAISDATPFVIDSGGNVGIGTSNPGFKLDVNGGARIGARLTMGGDIWPESDGIYNLGTGSAKWDTVFAVNDAINTSDARQKQQVRSITDAEKNVAIRCKSLLRAYKWNSSVETKADNARIHFGILAQDVKAAFEAEGLSAEQYGMFCYNTWEAEPDMLDKDGNIIKKGYQAGDAYGVRYSELLAFIIAAL